MKNNKILKSSDLPEPWNVILPTIARVFVWSLLFLTVYVLKSFFLLIFLTFVFAYLQNYIVNKLKPYIAIRWIRVVLVGVLMLAVIVAIFTYMFPQVRDQAEMFVAHHSQYLQKVDTQIIELSNKYPSIKYFFPQLEKLSYLGNSANQDMTWDVRDSLSARFLQNLVGFSGGENSSLDVGAVVSGVKTFVGGVLATGSSFLLSILFSFLIVLDLPKLTQSVRGLQHTKIGFVYDEVSSTLYNFARVVGSALVAQLFIAILNTTLTAIGIFLIGLGQHAAFLSIIVFLCSFIPVAGVFISSAPICLLSLLVVLLIWIIHLIEAYVLNPHIYGAQLRINAVLVLIILTLAGKLVGVWGLVLGLPVCTYVFAHAIRYDRDENSATEKSKIDK
jgi:predicted PurR-regulated permease PerM